MNPTQTKEVVNLLRSEIPELRAAYLYGSHASGHLHRESDTDIAIVIDRPLRFESRWKLQSTLGDLLDSPVDLVDLARTGLPLAAQILETGRVIFAGDPGWLAKFENVLMSRWCAFNEERRPLVDEIVARGSVYGG